MVITRATVIGLAFLLAACDASATNSAEAIPSTPVIQTASPQSGESVPATPSQTLVPRPTPLGDLGLGPAQVARVAVDGLAVRRAPSVEAPLVDGWLFHEELDNTWEKVTDELRFDAGHYVYLALGPLVIDGRHWFLVNNLPQPGDSDYSGVLRWDIEEDPDDGWDGWGWIAGADGSERLLEPGTDYESPVPGFAFQEPLARAYGIGDGATDPWDTAKSVGVSWAAADPEGSRCHMRVTVEPLGTVVIDAQVDGVQRGSDAVAGEESSEDDEGWLTIESDCSWSITAGTLI